jgi:hypothetical protein
MTNEVAKIGEENFFSKYGQAVSRQNIFGDLLLFSKFGEYVHGRDRLQLPNGTTVAGYMNTLTAGWVFWENGKITDTRAGLVAEGFIPPKREELGHQDQSTWERFDDGRPKDPWRLTNNLIMIDLETDAFFTFSTSSRGGLQAIGKLSAAYGQHMRQHPDDMPLIELSVSSYQHPNRSIGEVREPALKIVGWVASDKLPPLDGAPVNNDDNGDGDDPWAVPDPAPSKPAPQPTPAISAKAGAPRPAAPKAASPKARTGF